MEKQREPRKCFYVDETMATDDGFVPSVVVEGEWGHTPLSGNGDHASPWLWGQDIETARRICAEQNMRTFGVDEEAAREIVASSMFQKPQKRVDFKPIRGL